jgi:glyoxylase-like metal-dependent hydrolase (beta-lactamase superfamily II)
MDLAEIAPGVHFLPLAGSNAYVIDDEAGATLVDSGPFGSGPTIRAALDHLGIVRERLRHIVLTHAHDDHTGGAAEIAAWSGASVVVGRADAAVVRRTEPEPSIAFTAAERDLHAVVAANLPTAPACRVDREVGEGDVITEGREVRVLAVPGHTPGSLALLLPDHGLLLTGDTVAEHQGAVVLGPFNVDREGAWTSLQRLADLEPEVAAFGHGEPVAAAAATAIRRASDPFG